MGIEELETILDTPDRFVFSA